MKIGLAKQSFQNLYGSEVYRELERQAVRKGHFEPTPAEQVKLASNELAISKRVNAEVDLTPSSDLSQDIAKLAHALRRKGYVKQAEDLESNFVLFKQAETALYNVNNERAKELMEMAHSDGDVDIVDGGELGEIETIQSAADKILAVVNKKPTGKLASMAALIMKRGEVPIGPPTAEQAAAATTTGTKERSLKINKSEREWSQELAKVNAALGTIAAAIPEQPIPISNSPLEWDEAATQKFSVYSGIRPDVAKKGVDAMRKANASGVLEHGGFSLNAQYVKSIIYKDPMTNTNFMDFVRFLGVDPNYFGANGEKGCFSYWMEDPGAVELIKGILDWSNPLGVYQRIFGQDEVNKSPKSIYYQTRVVYGQPGFIPRVEANIQALTSDIIAIFNGIIQAAFGGDGVNITKAQQIMKSDFDKIRQSVSKALTPDVANESGKFNVQKAQSVLSELDKNQNIITNNNDAFERIKATDTGLATKLQGAIASFGKVLESSVSKMREFSKVGDENVVAYIAELKQWQDLWKRVATHAAATDEEKMISNKNKDAIDDALAAIQTGDFGEISDGLGLNIKNMKDLNNYFETSIRTPGLDNYLKVLDKKVK
jgi:hypothetical protein